MKLLEVLPGPWTIMAIADDRGDSDLLDYLASKEGTDEFEDIMSVLSSAAEHGPPPNKRKCRKLSSDIWEFKAGLIRVFFFFDKGKIIVCTHGVDKPKPRVLQRQIGRAESIRGKYLVAKRNGTLG